MEFIMAKELLVEFTGLGESLEAELAGLDEITVLRGERFEGHQEILEVIVPIAVISLAALRRLLTFIERLLEKGPEHSSLRIYYNNVQIGNADMSAKDIEKQLLELAERTHDK
jgi:hypothetical protein